MASFARGGSRGSSVRRGASAASGANSTPVNPTPQFNKGDSGNTPTLSGLAGGDQKSAFQRSVNNDKPLFIPQVADKPVDQQQHGDANKPSFGQQGADKPAVGPQNSTFGSNKPFVATGANRLPTGGGPRPFSAAAGGNLQGGADDKRPIQPRTGGDAPREPRGPHGGYNPIARSVDDLFKEDELVKSLYATVFEDDEQVTVDNVGGQAVAVMDKWEDIPLSSIIQTNIHRAGYIHPRKIQSHTIPLILEGRDLKAQAETGSGKSVAFIVPLIEKIMVDKKNNPITGPKNKPFAIIVEPTRELCLQVYEQARKLANGTGVQVVKCYGQYDATSNGREILQGCDIITATPGRLEHFVLNGNIDVHNLKYFVLDEADRFLDRSDFGDVLKKIRGVSTWPKDGVQTLLFSATFPPAVEELARTYLKPDHAYVHTKTTIAPNTKIAQEFIEVPGNEKKAKVLDLLEENLKQLKAKDPEATQPRTLIFVRSRSDADLMALFLCESEVRATTINGDRPQKERETALESFRTKKTPILVATDVCARGLDIKELDFVINMDLPTDVVTYVHRIGRTGRLRAGKAVSMFDPEVDAALAKELVTLLNNSNITPPEFLKKAAAKPAPMKSTGGGFGHTGGATGFASKPAGFGTQPAGFGTKPAGFGAKPAGFGNTPAAFGTKPAGFGLNKDKDAGDQQK